MISRQVISSANFASMSPTAYFRVIIGGFCQQDQVSAYIPSHIFRRSGPTLFMCHINQTRHTRCDHWDSAFVQCAGRTMKCKKLGPPVALVADDHCERCHKAIQAALEQANGRPPAHRGDLAPLEPPWPPIDNHAPGKPQAGPSRGEPGSPDHKRQQGKE